MFAGILPDLTIPVLPGPVQAGIPCVAYPRGKRNPLLI
jgi:hypothetical protein